MKKYTIDFDSKIAKIIQKLLIVVLVITCFVFCVGYGSTEIASKERGDTADAKKALKNIEVTFTGKENESYYSNEVEFNFTVGIKNDYKKAVNYIEGTLTIKNREGKVLTTGTASFGTTLSTTVNGYQLPAKSERSYSLTWEDALTDDTMEIWESEFSDLEFSFEITGIRVENGSVAQVKG